MPDPVDLPEPGGKQPTAAPVAAPLPEGDCCGEYGFGRPAHKPDPSGTYVFAPQRSRVLPVKARARWR